MDRLDEARAAVPGETRVWAPRSALRERRLVIEAGMVLHTLVRRIPFQTAADLLSELAVEGPIEWELAADGTRSQGMLRRLTGQVETLQAVTTRFTHNLAQWTPEPGSTSAILATSTTAPHPARHNHPADGNPVLIGYLITMSHTLTANQIR